MAYLVQTVTSVLSIPKLWGDFAQSIGFSVIGQGTDEPKIKHPRYEAGLNVKMSANISGVNHTLTLSCDENKNVVPAVTKSPITNPSLSVGGEVTSQPTKVHFIGNVEGEPFLATVIEYGFNSYRHIYFGYLKKNSNFEGGEVLSSANFFPNNLSHSGSGDVLGQYYQNPLFGCNWQGGYLPSSGGLRLIHAKSPGEFKRFDSLGYPSYGDDFARNNRDSCVIGGWYDCVNTGYALAGSSPFSAITMTNPINLLITTNLNNKTRFRLVGKVSGANFVSLADIEPATQVNVGSKKLIVFPNFTKSMSPSVKWFYYYSGGYRTYPESETSGLAGLAYEID